MNVNHKDFIANIVKDYIFAVKDSLSGKVLKVNWIISTFQEKTNKSQTLLSKLGMKQFFPCHSFEQFHLARREAEPANFLSLFPFFLGRTTKKAGKELSRKAGREE